MWAWIWQIAAAALEYTGKMWIFTMGLMFWLCYVQPCCAQSLPLLSISISPSHFDSSTSQFFRSAQVPGVSKPMKITQTPLKLLNEWRVSGGLASGELGLGFSSDIGCLVGPSGPVMRVEPSCTFFSSAQPFPVCTNVVHGLWICQCQHWSCSLVWAPGCEQHTDALVDLPDGQLSLF